MVNSSLAYEILLYLNSFYFGMFAACEIGMGVLKGINLNYTPQQIQTDACILVAILTVETIRVYFGRKGSLSEHGTYIDPFYWYNIIIYMHILSSHHNNRHNTVGGGGGSFVLIYSIMF